MDSGQPGARHVQGSGPAAGGQKEPVVSQLRSVIEPNPLRGTLDRNDGASESEVYVALRVEGLGSDRQPIPVDGASEVLLR